MNSSFSDKFNPSISRRTVQVPLGILTLSLSLAVRQFKDIQIQPFLIKGTRSIWPSVRRITSSSRKKETPRKRDKLPLVWISHARSHRMGWSSWIMGPLSVEWSDGHGSCFSLFLGPNDTLYCSLSDLHQVVSRSLRNNGTRLTIVAGSVPSALSFPRGIFVESSANLYVADSGNDRIHLFTLGQTNGSTVVGSGMPDNLILDADGSLFILDELSRVEVPEMVLQSEVRHRIFTSILSEVSSSWIGTILGFRSFFWRVTHLESPSMISSHWVLWSPLAGLSFNWPELSLCASWNPDTVTVANSSSLGVLVQRIFVYTNNTLYVVAESLFRIQIWGEGSVLLNSTSPVSAMIVQESCSGLFVDIKENLQCSFMEPINSTTIVAGNGTAGSALNQLNVPRGILVDFSLNLYVADCHNNRVLRFARGQLNGTVADGYLFISEYYNHRVVGPGANVFRCLMGCSGVSGWVANQLYQPWSFSFDRDGNLFVADLSNGRIQTFLLARNSCSECDRINDSRQDWCALIRIRSLRSSTDLLCRCNLGSLGDDFCRQQ